MRVFRLPLLPFAAVLTVAVVVAGLAGCTPKDPDVLVVGTDASFKPMEYINSETQKVEGFDIDLLHAIGEEAGLKFDVRAVAFDSLVAGLQTGEYGLVISSLSITEKRSKQVKFSDPYYQTGLVICVRSDTNDINTFEDLKGRKIAVQRGTTGADKAREIEGAEVKEFGESDLTFQVLTGGGVDAVINDEAPTLEAVKAHPEAYKIVGEKLSSESYGIAMPLDKPELHKKVNAALKTLRENGTYDRIYEKWFGKKPGN